MSTLDQLIDELIEARNKVAASERAAAQAATELQHAENLVKQALDGADDTSVVGRIAEKRMWVCAGLGGMALVRNEIDTIIGRVRAIGAGQPTPYSDWDGDPRGRSGNADAFDGYTTSSAASSPSGEG